MVNSKNLRYFVKVIRCLCLLAITCAVVPTLPAWADSKNFVYTFPAQDVVFPEGIALDGHDFYVGSTASGAVYRGTTEGDDDHKSARQLAPFLPGGVDGRTIAVGMKVDKQGLLWIVGGSTGKIWAYDLHSRQLVTSFTTPRSPTFINDLVVDGDGTIYATDSFSPAIYRITRNGNAFNFEVWLDLTNTLFQYQDGFNANGIVVSQNKKTLLVVQSNTGKLFRIDVASKAISQVDLGSQGLPGGDGMWLKGSRLFVVQGVGQVSVVKLGDNFNKGKVDKVITDATFDSPTTMALADDRLLVVNSQFARGNAFVAPFTVSSVENP
jgi:Cu-Zn family superoxide dismutase